MYIPNTGSNTASVIDSPYTTPHLFEEEILRSGNHITVQVQFKSLWPHCHIATLLRFKNK
ncbi:MAG: hypothetical protein P0116_11445 [Candidatus Nitrosocosmicus sp.]|nr:hypothetical protein [Candidatus Nitrosocosmicus sp.]